MQRTPRLRLGCMPDVSGAGSLIRDVRRNTCMDMATLRIKAWHPDRAWASDGFTRHILLKRLELVSDIRGLVLKRATRRILRREAVDIPIRDQADAQTLISYLVSFGAEVDIWSEI